VVWRVSRWVGLVWRVWRWFGLCGSCVCLVNVNTTDATTGATAAQESERAVHVPVNVATRAIFYRVVNADTAVGCQQNDSKRVR
jgi:hypothetical protein